MIFEKHVAGILLAALVAGCGNYSNEDLEFMNALPAGDDLQVKIPPRSSAVSLAEEADLARLTHDVSTGPKGLNALLSAIVNLVDAIRSLSPTSRTSTTRTWGPSPSADHPGWQAKMVITREPDLSKFDYEISFHRAGGPDTDWTPLLTGWFEAGATARRGLGHFAITTAALRAEGLDPNLGLLDHMEVDYSTAMDPVTISMDITSLPDPTNAAAILSATYDYAAAQDGRHEMNFGFVSDLVPGPAGLETSDVTTLWLDTGEGTGTLTVVSGDGQGATWSQCWDRLFRPTYSHQTWALDLPGLGDPSVCPSIPPLF
jgi:hypothetical protein